MVRFLILAVLFSLLTAPTIGQSADGILIIQRVTFEGGPLTKRVQITATRMRTEVAGPNGATQVTIFDGGKQAPQMASQLPAVSPIDLRDNSGFPVKTVMMVQGHTVTMEVIELGRQTFSDSSFAVPAGFTKQDIMGAMGGRGSGAER
jgi:hypothetical protein